MMKRNVLLFDVLPNSIFVEEHLPGAVSLPLQTLDRSAVADVDRSRSVIVYCFDQH